MARDIKTALTEAVIAIFTLAIMLFGGMPCEKVVASEQKEVVLLTFDSEIERTQVSTPINGINCGYKTNKIIGHRKAAFCEIKQTQFFYIKLTPGWNSSEYKKPQGIRLYSATDTDCSAEISAMLTETDDALTGKNLTLDKTELFNYENSYYARLSGSVSGYNYLRLTVTADLPLQVFVDNITLVYSATAENTFNHINSYSAIYDWENSSKGISQNGNSFSRSKNISFSDIEKSAYALKCTGSYNGTDGYLSVDTADLIPEYARTVRVALFCAVSTEDNPTKVGVKSEGKIYWSEIVEKTGKYFWYYFDENTFTDENGTVFASTLNEIETILFSFGNAYSKFYIDDIQVGRNESFDVYLDGENIKSASCYTLPAPIEQGFVAYTDGKEYYEQNEAVILEEDTFFSVVSVGEIKTPNKASVRLGDISGLRFYTVLDSEKLENLPEAATVEKGTYIGPSDIFDGSDIRPLDEYPNNFNCVDVKYKSSEYYENGNTIVGTLSNILDKNISREFTAIGYIKVTINDITQTILSFPAKRSIKTVAALFREDEQNLSLYTVYKSQIDTWADHD